MLELLGKGYVIEHCISFFQYQKKEQLYREYVTDALRVLTYNTSGQTLGAIENRYAEIVIMLTDKKARKKEKTAEEVISDIRKKLSRG